MSDRRKALRTIPAYDPDNNIGAVDRVRFAMINNRMDALHQNELVQFERWKQIDDWIRERRSKTHKALRNAVMAAFDISWDTAERDIRNAKDLFKASNDDNEYYRSVYIEDLESVAAQAREDGDYQAYDKLMNTIAKMRNLYEKPAEEIPYNKLEAFVLHLEYNPEAVGLTRLKDPEAALAKWNKKKSISDHINSFADDAELG
jgi:hypothetical protein